MNLVTLIVCRGLQASDVASVSGFGRLRLEVGDAAGQAAGLRQGLDTQRAAFASLQDAAKVTVMRTHVPSGDCSHFPGCWPCHTVQVATRPGLI